MDPQFGGKTLESNRGTTAGGPAELPSVEAHGEYWKQDSPSLRGMGKIVAGQLP